MRTLWILLALSLPLGSAFAQDPDVDIGQKRTVSIQPGALNVQVCVYHCAAADPVAEVLECVALANDQDPIDLDVTGYMTPGGDSCFRALGVGQTGIYSEPSANAARGAVPVPPTLLAP